MFPERHFSQPKVNKFIIHEFSSFDDLTSEFNALAKNEVNYRFETDLDWYKNLEECGLSRDMPTFLVGVENKKAKYAEVFFPLLFDARSRKLKALVNFYSSFYAPYIRGDGAEEALQYCFSELLSHPNKFSAIDLHPLPFDDEIYSHIEKSQIKAGWKNFRYFCFGNWYLSVNGRSYDEYYQGLPSILKSTIKRKGKKFTESLNGTIELCVGINGLERAIADYLKIYQASWKIPEPFPGFIPGLLSVYAKKGQLRFAIAYVGGEPAAAQIWIVHNGRAAIYKLAYDEKFSSLSVGTILTNYLMRHVIDIDGVKEVDYLTGDERYKQDWMNNRRERWGIIAYNPKTLRGMAGLVNEYLRRLVKRFIFWMHKTGNHSEK